ncbi:MurR/RpiR family transcriptional regulator [Mesorhizobium sp. VK22B]|uniref:MurR/RpiR family transcriptional regulator n=1 Tax=Mesorhizobium captivum TaxID=3072319 RepID=A0ABU4ZA20_9HYPH|nr:MULTISPECIES: MurR/RpiR family transcriptional regulator [unclassified Mesorhizobium]MDX8496135.1 MurR/RpiR family transcriptional regulator [Mesorhizobium sp. VK22B]MDX8509429.1 MurR/RpiR family transcriptional regulator [Mesorhizobium sp. VK22E]
MAELLVERFENMPPQLRVAARFVLDHPKDVALMSMREQAHQAGVSHSTMMRLARWLGLDGYEDMRSLYARALRETAAGGPARQGVEKEGASGFSTAGVVADSIAAQISSLGEYGSAMQFVAAADLVARSSNLFGLGLRSACPVASHFVQVMSFLAGNGRKVTLVGDMAGQGLDALRLAGDGDVLLAVGMAPYDRTTIEVARQAARQRVGVVAITDSSVSPLTRIAQETIIVTSSSQSFFRSMAPAFAAVEILAALTATRSEANAAERVRQSEEQLAAFGIYWKPPR